MYKKTISLIIATIALSGMAIASQFNFDYKLSEPKITVQEHHKLVKNNYYSSKKQSEKNNHSAYLATKSYYFDPY